MYQKRFFIVTTVLFLIAITSVYAVIKKDHRSHGDNLHQPIVSKPDCDGKDNPYYDLGYGIEHEYKGNIRDGMPVQIVLSCDLATFTITGSVQQVIKAEDIPHNDGDVESIALADLIAGTEVVDVNSDYNFDGYNDLSSIATNGQGTQGVDSYLIFLYDTKRKQFIFNKDLSSIKNIHIPEGSQKQIASNEYLDDGYKTTFYTWINGKIVKEKTTKTCTDKSIETNGSESACK